MAHAIKMIMSKIMELVVYASTWAIFMYFIFLWFFTPTTAGWGYETLVSLHTQTFGSMAGVYVLYTCPIVALALLGALHLHLSREFRTSSSNSCSRAPRMWRMLWTRPVIINRMFGVMAIVDLAAITSTLVLVVWLFYSWYAPQVKAINAGTTTTTGTDKVVAKVAQAGTMLGRVSVLLIMLLFLPVTRNSSIVRILGLPFEQAVKYHKWVGCLLFAILLGHGGAFMGVYAQKHTWHRLISVTTPAGNNAQGVLMLPGLVALLVAIYMVATSLPAIRRHHFNFFYYSHQLYVVFLVGFIYHVGVKTAGYAMGAVFLFFLDRFMRCWQSSRLIHVSHARVSSDGIIELKVPRSPTLMYNALSFMFIKVPGVSHLQWHPFSVASSAQDGTGEMTIYIKGVTCPEGQLRRSSWTTQVAAHVTHVAKLSAQKGCPFSMGIVAEGPYGHKSEYYLNYKTLVLVAGGIGITPFMAIIQDILHRYRITSTNDKEEWLPKNIVLIWAVRSESELDILRQVSPGLIFSDYKSGKCRIRVRAYATQMQTNKAYVDNNAAQEILPQGPTPNSEIQTNMNCVRPVVGTGDNLWMFWMILITMCVTVVMFRGLNVVHQSPYFQWIQVSLLFASMFVGIVGSGTVVLLCWTGHCIHKEKKMIANQAQTTVALNENGLFDDVEGAHPTLYDMAERFMSARPKFSHEFSLIAMEFGHEDIGVLVSGPEGLQSSVAKECQRRSGLQATLSAQIFNYHSVSFSL